MPTTVKKRITVRELREHPERYPHIAQAAESFKPLVARFLAAKKEAEQVFENLRGADMDEAVAYCREHPLSPEAVAVLIHVAHRAQMLEKAKAAVSTKLANDPKQAAMRQTFELWHEWRAGKSVHKSAAAFARYVVGKFPVIESPVTVQRWVTKWTRQAKPSTKSML
ncbi:MAG: hypothetical protein KGJ94_02480 [Xanthomonadaceae bacterium]|nr:hypothetical protein [Xanthomonadaceae bacterium]